MEDSFWQIYQPVGFTNVDFSILKPYKSSYNIDQVRIRVCQEFPY